MYYSIEDVNNETKAFLKAASAFISEILVFLWAILRFAWFGIGLVLMQVCMMLDGISVHYAHYPGMHPLKRLRRMIERIQTPMCSTTATKTESKKDM